MDIPALFTRHAHQSAGLVAALLTLAVPHVPAAPANPNVIVLLTDDQGYGDLSCHGNPVLKTPNFDRLHAESVRFTDFHVAPMCSPTRGQLMTGMDAMRNGATAVCQGRSMIRPGIKLMPQFFREAGYATGIFGKWHLGDSYPYRPKDRGFDKVLSFRAWGITSLADYWMNDYFDPWLLRRGEYERQKGYCADIFFAEAMKWIAKCQSEQKPFFAYLPINTPHVPELVAPEYAAPYQGTHQGTPMPKNFYGMIANIDENVGKLEAFLQQAGLRDNTIMIFLSDNGTQSGPAAKIFNAGMRDKKTSVYEGGHRVPLFVRWIDGKLQHGTDLSELTQVQDLLPTLIDLCGLRAGEAKFDGVSLKDLLTGRQTKLADRMCVSQYRVDGGKWSSAVVMWNKWRLLAGNKLYDLGNDPHQDNDLQREHPEIVGKMNAFYDAWHAAAKPLFDLPRPITLGSAQANPQTLYANDWLGGYCDNRGGLIQGEATGTWDLLVDRDGTYEFELRRWPEESGKALSEAFANSTNSGSGARPIAKAQLRVADFNATTDTKSVDTCAKFTVPLKAGPHRLTANFLDQKGTVLCGAFYVKATLTQ